MTNDGAFVAHAGASITDVPPSGEPAGGGMCKPLPPLDPIGPAHVRYVRSVVRRLSVIPEDGREDLVQEVLFQAHRSRGSRLEVRPLLFGITRHMVLSWWADHRAEQTARERCAGVDPVPFPCAEEDWQARLRCELVRAAIDDLSEPFREVFFLTQIEGVPMPSVARTQGIPVNTGYARLHVARARFRDCLDRILARRRMEGWELF